MMRTRVKFCGMTQIDDAKQAVQLGVDALGFIFHPSSPRAVSVNQARHIVCTLPALVQRVGVFVNQSASEIKQIVEQVGLTAIQLHGDQSATFCQQFQLPVIKAISMTEQTDIVAALTAYQDVAQLLLDTAHPLLHGGSGQAFDWRWIPVSVRSQVILAGGLTPANVAQAIAQIQPAAVDVSSGIEDRPGVKDPVKMERFMAQVRVHQ
ncbi:MAG: phosphoribosylanthranilate isomerase [Legionellales bacterium]|nr:phosphoribosylanthranilate isomerase [Legionellales bacterium]